MKKQKFKSAEEARTYRELNASWDKLLEKHKPISADKLIKKPIINPMMERIKKQAEIKSLGSGIGVATLKKQVDYTGTKMIGISTMHKSNAVPVFSKDEAIEISSMRR